MDKNFESRFRAATKAADQSGITEPRATNVAYNPRLKRIVVDLANGSTFIFPPALAQGLSDAETKELKNVAITPSGEGLRWESLDVDLSLTSLLTGIFGNRAWMSELGRRGGKSTSELKSAASRVNGRKGGRPSRKLA